MAACYAIAAMASGTASFLIAWLAGHGLPAAMAFYVLAGLCGILLVALRQHRAIMDAAAQVALSPNKKQ